jgi:hypothetical protein
MSMVDLPFRSPIDSLDYGWQNMAEGTIVSADEEFIEEFRILGESYRVSEPRSLVY